MYNLIFGFEYIIFKTSAKLLVFKSELYFKKRIIQVTIFYTK